MFDDGAVPVLRSGHPLFRHDILWYGDCVCDQQKSSVERVKVEVRLCRREKPSKLGFIYRRRGAVTAICMTPSVNNGIIGDWQVYSSGRPVGKITGLTRAGYGLDGHV